MNNSNSEAWPKTFVECHGDYAAQVGLEDHNKPLYLHQEELPSLPVPSLEDTIRRFLPTALPLAENDAEIKSLLECCDTELFVKQATKLQERLLERREACQTKQTSWLQLWWNTTGYLQVREPIPVNISYFFPLEDAPQSLMKGFSMSLSLCKSWMRGAIVLRSVAEYRDRVVSQELPQECRAVRHGSTAQPLCSAAYKHLFHACRIPRSKEDSYRLYNPSNYASHAIVAFRNQFYEIQLRHASSSHEPSLLLSVSELQEELRGCIEYANDGRKRRLPELGWLTSSNRTVWAAVRKDLIDIGGNAMEKALERLESSMVLLCLDQDEPETLADMAREFWHGDMSSGGNRWFDKSIQLVVSRNGKLAYVGEHSMADGMPASGICQFILNREKEVIQGGRSTNAAVKGDNAISSSHVSKSTNEWMSSHQPSVVPYREVLNIFEDCMAHLSEADVQKIEKLACQAKDDFSQLTSVQDIAVKHFQCYGSNYIKSNKFSPDAYVQMAIQLATYRLFGRQTATYEATQVRSFLHGRTETTRSVSTDSAAFVKCMGSKPLIPNKYTHPATLAKKMELLRRAVETHVAYTRNACRGQGIDRHFFGLSMVVREGETAPALFSHPLFRRSKEWRVTTSAVPNLKPGFGAVVDDGVGIGYEVLADALYFNIAAPRVDECAVRLCHHLEEALLEMKSIVDAETRTAAPTPA